MLLDLPPQLPRQRQYRQCKGTQFGDGRRHAPTDWNDNQRLCHHLNNILPVLCTVRGAVKLDHEALCSTIAVARISPVRMGVCHDWICWRAELRDCVGPAPSHRSGKSALLQSDALTRILTDFDSSKRVSSLVSCPWYKVDQRVSNV